MANSDAMCTLVLAARSPAAAQTIAPAADQAPNVRGHRRYAVAAFAIGAILGGCDRSRPAPTGAATTAAAPGSSAAGGSSPSVGSSAQAADASAVAGGACKLDPVPARFPAPKRLVAIGDIHGDLAAARAALRTAGAIDTADKWIGGDLVIVQTGDVLDRGDDEQAIIDLFARLEIDARAAGGNVIVLNGNHELMNAVGDFRYVTPGGAHDFDEEGGRAKALGPGGSYARREAKHNAIAIVGDAIFSHAGVLGDWVGKVDEVNATTRCFLDGQTREPPPAASGDDTPLWTRAVGLPEADCAAAKAALTKLQLSRMVVGHTVQDGGITSACDGAVWRIDVGLAKKYGGPIQVLQLYPETKVLTGTRL